MAAIEPKLFGWEDVEARSDLERFYLVRDHLPDGRLVQYLEVMRSRGRDDYPVRGMWNAVLAGVVFQHPSLEGLLRESLMGVLADFGQHLGFDGKAIDSHSTGRVDRERGQTSDPDADWGKHETRGVDGRTGKPWTKIKSWVSATGCTRSPTPTTRSRWPWP
jgi:hypothetical protein